MMSWSSRKKKEGIFSTVYFVRRKFFNIYVLNTLSEYTHFYISKHITSYTFFCLFLKSLKAFSVSLKTNTGKWINLKVIFSSFYALDLLTKAFSSGLFLFLEIYNSDKVMLSSGWRLPNLPRMIHVLWSFWHE